MIEGKMTTQAMASAIWLAMDENEKTGVRIGLFPLAKMKAAEDAGFNGKDLCVTLMNCAKEDGGMIA